MNLLINIENKLMSSYYKMKTKTNIYYIGLILFVIIIAIVVWMMKIQLCEGLTIVTENMDEKYTALIVEPRKHRALHFVLKNFFENLDKRWNFVILHGSDNVDYLNKIMDQLEEHKSRTKLINLNKPNLTYHEYNALFYTKSFYDYIHTETFLIFQTDSMILSRNKDKINDFLKYDYVGAPIPCEERIGSCENKEMVDGKYYEVGNGGLSLRKKSKMIELLQYVSFAKAKNEYISKHFGNYVPEDRFFNGEMTKKYVKVYKPDVKEACNFAIESFYYDSPFGVHKVWNGSLSKSEYEKLIDKYPKIKILKVLNENNLFEIE
jgi:hypothetical protein